jgi:hypothetical protein
MIAELAGRLDGITADVTEMTARLADSPELAQRLALEQPALESADAAAGALHDALGELLAAVEAAPRPKRRK